MLSQTIEYALRAMVHLAGLSPGRAVNSATIAARTHVPPGYLSKVLRDLVVADLVVSQRGRSGGFALARDASRISILDVINAVDPIQRIRECPIGDPNHVQLCPLHQRVDGALDFIEQQFRATSLSEVLSKEQAAAPAPSAVQVTTLGKRGPSL